MASNQTGIIFSFTSFGESHGKAIGGVVDGCPAGLEIDERFIQNQLNRRRPGQSSLTTQRNEKDEVIFLSGIFEGKSTGHPIAFIIENKDAKPADYNQLEQIYRPSHADFTYDQKYGIRDFNGGGRASARITAAWVVAGSIASLLIKNLAGITVNAYVSKIHHVECPLPWNKMNLQLTDSNPVRCPDEQTAAKMQTAIENARDEGDSLGGIISGVILNTPVGLGEPVFNKLHAALAKAMFSINAVKGFEIGDGFDITSLKGSEANDGFMVKNEKVKTITNHSGGIQGGISNGEPIIFRLAFKPTATVKKQQQTINQHLQETTLEASGRHDPCVLPRAVPIVESMAALVLADFILLNRLSKIK